MSSSDASQRPRATLPRIEQFKEQRDAAKAIADGRLSQLHQLHDGLGFTSGSWQADCKLAAEDESLRDDISDDLRTALQHLSKTLTKNALEAVRALAIDQGEDDLADRMDIYLAAIGSNEATRRLTFRLLQSTIRRSHRRVAFAVGLVNSRHGAANPIGAIEAGRQSLQRILREFELDVDVEAQLLTAAEPAEDHIEQQVEALTRALEDRAEITPDGTAPAEEPTPEVRGLQVIPPEAVSGTGAGKKEILKGLAPVIGATLPYVLAPDPVEVVARFRRLMPHAVQQFIRILGHHQSGDPLRLAPVLLLGPPGSGKTTMIRAIAEVLGLPCEVHSMAGAADSSIMGTSSQYATARMHPVLQLIASKKIPNPLVGWDELEKVGSGRHNGNPLDALLPVLEQHTARRYRDLALEVEVDLSMVSHIATANSLEGIPRPVLDRFRVITMPEPGWQHVGALSRSILNRIAEERGLSPAWFPSFDGDELEALRTVWNGGSIRRLERAIRLMVDARDKLLGQA